MAQRPMKNLLSLRTHFYDDLHSITQEHEIVQTWSCHGSQKIKDVQEVTVSRSMQTKDASQLQEFLAFCDGLGIKNQDTFLASEDLLVGWASSYAGPDRIGQGAKQANNAVNVV